MNAGPHPAEGAQASVPVVGIGASAGGLEAFGQLLRALPEHTGLAYVLIQHLDPTHPSQLVGLLAQSTAKPVLEAREGLALQADHVYVIAPNTALGLDAAGALSVRPRTDLRGPHLPIDHFFRAMAEQRQSGAIGVVLSGTGSDGTLGLEEIKAAGGITFSQDEASAAHPGMPQSAIRSGCVDLTLAPERIAAELSRIGLHDYLAAGAASAQGRDEAAGARPEAGQDEIHYQSVLALLRRSSDVDFSAYRDTTVKRRIARRMALQGGQGLGEYVEYLRDNRSELDSLYQDILINVTSFFRDPAAFESLVQRGFPAIVAARQGDSPIRIWVPGCSSGQEAYSLAMALSEFLDATPQRPKFCIFATDLSESVSLRKAREGLYPESIEAELSRERLARFFVREPGGYRINKSLRETIVFARQNVAADPPFSRIDLISCRNLLIYLSPALQKRVIPTFHYALNPGGFLLLGGAESIGGHGDLFTAVDAEQRLYLRKTSPGRPYPHFRVDADRGPRGGASHDPTISARPMPADWQREADRVAAGRYVPPGVLVNDAFDILQFRGHTGAFLAPAAGDPSHNLMKMAREGLFMPLREAVHECQRTREPVRQTGVRVRGASGELTIELQVMPVRLPPHADQCYLVLFESPGSAAPASAADSAPAPAGTADAERQDSVAEVKYLRQELAATRDYLQSLVEQQDAANEELKSANEEVLSSNEELQSTNEELETAKEELQSVNEELTTVNEQLQHRNVELGGANDDISNLLASSGVAYLTLDIELRIRRFTPAGARLLGLLAADIGRPIASFRARIELPELEPLASAVRDGGQMQQREVEGPDGRSHLLRIHPYRSADQRIEGVVLVFFDIDELRRAQIALSAARDYADAIVETVRDPLLTLDSRLCIRSANQAFYAMFQVTPEATLGRPLAEIGNRQWDLPLLGDRLAGVLATGVPFADLDVRHDFESIGPKVMRLNARRIARADGRAESILLAIEDQTAVDRLESEARDHLEHLAETDRHKMQFLAVLAHELRNPLAPIRNGLEILERSGNQDESPRRVRAMIGRQIEQLTRLVDDLLDVARINRGHIEMRYDHIDLGALVRGAAEAASLGCVDRKVELTLSVPAQSLWLVGDAARLSQALGNVLSNATKFTDAGGGVAVRLLRDGNDARVLVSDTGIGIAADQLPFVFEMFMQAQPTHERSRSGLGIGLALVKQLVEVHGGSVAMRSPGLGRGCEFEIRLPLTESASVPGEAAVAPASALPEPGRRILVVDDNVDAADSLAALLALDGHEVRSVHDGAEAVEMAAQWRPDIVLLDIGLPGLTGHQAARKIREQLGGRAVLLVAISGLGQTDDLLRSRDAGFDAHLVKPVALQQLSALIVSAPRSIVRSD